MLLWRIRKKLEELAKEARCSSLAARSFVDRSLARDPEKTWLFLLTFPNGGSTAFAKLMLTARSTVGLTPRAEGQWLVPSLHRPGKRWDPDHRISYRKVRAVWLNELRALCPGPCVVIEKSPPNLCRYRPLVEAFSEMPHHIVTFSRDPYATCASWDKRYGVEGVRKTWGFPTGVDVSTESGYFAALAAIWIERARMLLAARADSCVDTSYEAFSADPAQVIAELARAVPQLATADPSATVEVKDYEAQAIRNMNREQIERLSTQNLESISRALQPHEALVSELGYRIL